MHAAITLNSLLHLHAGRTMRRNESEVTAFADAMLRELEINAHKGGWEHESVGWLLRRMKQEVRELDRALKKGAPMGDVISEAADVANFAMMIATNYTRQYRLPRNG